MQKSRPEVVLATKFFPYPWRLSRSSLTAALRSSLKRLNVPQVDLYILHFPVPPVPLATWVEALADVQAAGLTRAVGISNCNLSQMKRAHAVLAKRGLPLASNQVEYSLLHRNPERNGLLAGCRDLGVTMVAYRPLGYGLLTGKYKPEDLPAVLHGRLITKGELLRVTPLVDLLRQLGEKHGKIPLAGGTELGRVQGRGAHPGRKESHARLPTTPGRWAGAWTPPRSRRSTGSAKRYPNEMLPPPSAEADFFLFLIYCSDC